MKRARFKAKRKAVKHKGAVVKRAADVSLPGEVYDGVSEGHSVDFVDGRSGIIHNCTINGVPFP